MHTCGLALLLSPFCLPSGASTRDEHLLVIWAVWGCAAFCFAASECLARQRFAVFRSSLVCSTCGGSTTIDFSDLTGLHVSGTGIFLKTKNGRVRSFSRGFSREVEMLALIESRRIEAQTPNKAPEPTP